MKPKILAAAIAIALLFAAVPGLVGFIGETASYGRELPLELEYKGTKYIQTWGIIPEEQMIRSNLIRSSEWTGGYEIYISPYSQPPYDEIYVRQPGYGCILYVTEASTQAGRQILEIRQGVSSYISGNKGLATVTVSPSSYPTADQAARRVLGYWDNSDSAVTNTKYLLYTEATKSAVTSELDDSNLRYWFSVGHGNEDLIAVYGDYMYYYDFSGLGGLEDAGIVLNSCYTYNGRLKQSITAERPAFYMAGAIALPVGPSEEVSGDFWYFYSVLHFDEVTALNMAVQQNPGTDGWFGLWT